ncbi:hypothetical protein Emin_0205 [Elusimicrobium minutum Pei191]|uniref:Outer membrane protein beta-barrel domain-containing protein n=1 Tax=Elusimicrobium minutum (strain Pei191) TaxID=445932 RepID=B2KB09_ELUMP|nr:hypothetical protein [Elusimicrobium minutum]ACC97768.1 hypothetical protein Emin_0205 [Elusimicrobium minutum Pei191]
MKKILFLVFILFAGAAFAQNKSASFDLAFQMSNYEYREPEVDVKLSGPKYGMSGDFTAGGVGTSTPLFLSLQGLFMLGNIEYEGSVVNTSTGQTSAYTADGIKDFYIEGRALLGVSFEIPKTSLELWPYFGLGYRYLFNGMGEVQYGYDRESRYTYAPLGLKAVLKASESWLFSLNAEYNLFLSGTQRSDWNGWIENEQEKGYGMRFSARITKNFEKIGLFIEPFFRYWHIKDSKIAGVPGTTLYIYEPENKTKETGLKLGITF